MHLCTSDWKNLSMLACLSVHCSSNWSTMHKAENVDECWVSTLEANASLPPSKPLEKHIPEKKNYEAHAATSQGITSEFQQLQQHTMTEMDCASSPHSTANTNSLVHRKGFGPSPSMTTPEANSTQQQSTMDVSDTLYFTIILYSGLTLHICVCIYTCE